MSAGRPGSLRSQEVALLLLVTAAGAWLRLRTLGAEALWGDEVLTVTYGSRSYADLWLRPGDPTPPLYFTLHKLLIGITHSATALRSLSAAVGIAAIPVMHLLGRSLAGRRAGLLAAGFLAVNGPHIEYSQEARAYALLFLLMLATALALAEYLRRAASGGEGAGRWYAAYVAFGLLAVYTHYTAILWLAGAQILLLAELLLRKGARARPARIWLAGSVWLLLGVLPALWMASLVLVEFQTVQPIGVPAFATLMRQVALLRVHLPWRGVAEAALLLAVLPGIVAIVRNPRAGAIVGLFAAFPLILWAAQVVKPVLMFRTALIFAVAPILLWSIGAARLPRLAAGGLAAAVAAASLAGHLSYERTRPQHYDWPEAVRLLEERGRPGDVVILCQWYAWPAFRFHTADDSRMPAIGVWLADTAIRWPAPAREERDELLAYAPPERERIGPADVLAGQAPGSTGWVVYAHCPPVGRAALDGFLENLGAEARPVWSGQSVAIGAFTF